MTCAVPRGFLSDQSQTKNEKESLIQMNILVTSASPQTCARNLDNWLLEDQILTVARLMSAYAKMCSYHINDLYLGIQTNHPFLRWLQNDETNVDWLKDYGMMLLVEYGGRHGRKHGNAEAIIVFIDDFGAPLGLDPQAFLNRAWNETFDFRFEPDVHKAYRWFVAARWSNSIKKLSWVPRMPPAWYIEHEIARGMSEHALTASKS